MAPLSNSSRVLYIGDIVSNVYESDICDFLQKAPQNTIVHIVKRFHIYKNKALLIEFSTHDEAASVLAAVGPSFTLNLDGTPQTFTLAFSRRDTLGNYNTPVQPTSFSLGLSVEVAPGVAVTPRWVEKSLRECKIRFSSIYSNRDPKVYVVRFPDSEAMEEALKIEVIKLENPKATFTFTKSMRRRPVTHDVEDSPASKCRVDTPWTPTGSNTTSSRGCIAEVSNLNPEFFSGPNLVFTLGNLFAAVTSVKVMPESRNAFICFTDPEAAKTFVTHVDGMTLFGLEASVTTTNETSIESAGETRHQSQSAIKKYFSHNPRRHTPSPSIYVGNIPESIEMASFNIPPSLLKKYFVKDGDGKSKFAIIELTTIAAAVEAAVIIYSACSGLSKPNRHVRISFSQRKYTDQPAEEKKLNFSNPPSEVEAEEPPAEIPVEEEPSVVAPKIEDPDDNWY